MVTATEGRVEDLAKQVVDCAFQVHTTLGPGLLESIYEGCLAHELGLRKIAFKRQLNLPVKYKDLVLPDAFRLDLLVADLIVIEVKSVESLDRIHTAQLLTYMKLANLSLGFLINFNVPLIKDGIKRLKL